MWQIEYTPSAAKDAEKVKKSHLYEKAKRLIEVLRTNPYQRPPEYEKLLGDLKGAYSRRLNRQHRLIYAIDETRHVVRILAMWSHYE